MSKRFVLSFCSDTAVKFLTKSKQILADVRNEHHFYQTFFKTSAKYFMNNQDTDTQNVYYAS